MMMPFLAIFLADMRSLSKQIFEVLERLHSTSTGTYDTTDTAGRRDHHTTRPDPTRLVSTRLIGMKLKLKFSPTDVSQGIAGALESFRVRLAQGLGRVDRKQSSCAEKIAPHALRYRRRMI